MCLAGYGTPFLYRRFASEGLVGMFVAEISNPFLNMRLIFEYMPDNSIANFFRFLFRSGNVDGAENKRRANLIRTINNVIFIIIFSIARPLGMEILGYNIHNSQAPLHFKISVMALWFLSYIWLWEIINKASKILATDVFPNNRILGETYKAMKAIRPYFPVYLMVVT